MGGIPPWGVGGDTPLGGIGGIPPEIISCECTMLATSKWSNELKRGLISGVVGECVGIATNGIIGTLSASRSEASAASSMVGQLVRRLDADDEDSKREMDAAGMKERMRNEKDAAGEDEDEVVRSDPGADTASTQQPNTPVDSPPAQRTQPLVPTATKPDPKKTETKFALYTGWLFGITSDMLLGDYGITGGLAAGSIAAIINVCNSSECGKRGKMSDEEEESKLEEEKSRLDSDEELDLESKLEMAKKSQG